MQHSDEKLGTGRIWPLMLAMGVPSLLAQLVNLLYSLVDRIYIGHIPGIGAQALTGIGVTAPISMLISGFSGFAGNGGAPLAAIELGRGDRAQAQRIMGNSLFLLLMFSILLPAAFFLVKKPFLYAVGASDATYVYADQYITIYVLGTIFVLLTLGLNVFITAQGQPKIAMVSVLIGAAVNIALDPVFIFLLHMDVAGAALATVLAQACSAIWVVGYLMRPSTALRINLRCVRPSGRLIRRISALGVSSFIMNSTESLIQVVINAMLQLYGGDLHEGAMTICHSVSMFIYVPPVGFMRGVQPIMSYNYGASKMDRVRRTFYLMLASSMVMFVTLTLLAMIFPRQIALAFTDSAPLIDLVGRVMPLFLCGTLVMGFQTSCQMAFISLNQTKMSLFLALLRKVILLAPLALILPRVLNNVMGVYYAEVVSDYASVAVCVTVMLTSFRRILADRPE